MYFSKAQRIVLSSSLAVFIAGCGSPNYAPSEMHMTIEEVKSTAPQSPESIPSLVKSTPTVPIFSNDKEEATFDVIVTSIPVRDLLFSLARDAGVNMDVDAKVGGLVTMSALDQTLEAILARIAEQIPIRIEHIGNAMIVKNDEPYHKRYHVDYTSVSRTFDSDAEAGGVGDTSSATISNSSENNFWENLEESIGAILEVELEAEESGSLAGDAASENSLLSDADEAEASFTSDNSFDFNTDTGILLVYAPDRLQKEVEQYLDEAMSISRRQVLLEATVVEVALNNQYAQGVDWSVFNQFASKGLALYQGANIGAPAAFLAQVVEGFDFSDTQVFIDHNGDGLITREDSYDIGSTTANNNTFSDYSNYTSRNNPSVQANINGGNITDFSISNAAAEASGTNPNATIEVTREYSGERVNREATALRSGGLVPNSSSVPGAAFTAAYRSDNISAAVELLDTFGDAKVLSSPRISVLNNQPALLRVVDQEVYFNIEVTDDINEDTGQVTSRSYDISENTVDVGFSMNVLPHITSGDEIFLNLKPSVTRVLEYRRAPTPAGSGLVDNLVPITRIRELESVMSLRDGEIAVMGGLLEDRTGDSNTSVPGLSELPGVGTLFQKKNESTYKTEFVVFIKARIITNPSIHGDYADYRDLLPDSDFIIRDRTDTGFPAKQRKTR